MAIGRIESLKFYNYYFVHIS